ncbi:MAG: Arc family DNA-binding protein [Rhodobacter sp.]|nr:Arc family DNA-binding protein [Rhodobacter sp.]MCA3493662.1 Arc family DNA-binding protein [Rhodobacter sp.]MCA3500165.1 Arc family DNA-binding protein [Rhodobacter sp.]MCA3503169.1 Arc family DNA-binding protein [Rhodobacter sp.]MCA3517402.1 Arc family DNA-binding protein [Rhodobacter sp.]
MSDAPSQSQDKFIVRLPDGMRERIKTAAEANRRSMNAEIVARLEWSFSPVADVPSDHIPLDKDEVEKMDEIVRAFSSLLMNRRSRGKAKDEE